MMFLFLFVLLVNERFIDTSATVIGINLITNSTESFEDYEAQFGTEIGQTGLTGILELAEPLDACIPLKHNAWDVVDHMNISNVFVLIQRGGCDFGKKILNAQTARYNAAIVFNSDGQQGLIPMATTPDMEKLINIPSVFVNWQSGDILRSNYLYKERNETEVTLTGDPGFCLKCYIIPFLAVIGSSLLVLLIFVGVRVGRDRRRRRRNRLSRQRLKQLPTKQFQKGDEYDVCAICLDDYEEGDTLRILPCNHAYHCKCVDPWLTSSRRVCPLCKRRVLSDDESSSDSDYESDGEERPLLHSDSASSLASNPRQLTYGTGPSNGNDAVLASSSTYSLSSDEYQPSSSYQNGNYESRMGSYSGSSVLSTSSSSSSITVLEEAAHPSSSDIPATISAYIPDNDSSCTSDDDESMYGHSLPLDGENPAFVSDEVENFEVESSASQDIIVLIRGDETHNDEFESNA